MSTEQNYVGRANYANSPVPTVTQILQTAINAVPSVENRPSAHFSYSRYLIDQLCQEGRITPLERPQAGIATTQDDSMSPRLPEGVDFIAVTVQPVQYHTLIGKVVAVTVKADRFAFYLGRVVCITPHYVRVSRDNAEWSDRIESRSVIASMARVVSVLEVAVN
ncbi:hypothetical protein [Spirosoma validum]|uniref:Uncharacterized protein n=1 Tax=Spirosoma validum TaxID=2771355 RepID=A0A927AZH7_9BACT|nr:hypothetical protein [Spirosoma validum]MBD2752625.1 hypothetical protein [Spirosoma validum]